MFSRISLGLFIAVIFSGCFKAPFTHVADAKLNRIDTSYHDLDASIEELISPYRDSIESEMNEVIGYSTQEYVKSRPESALGNIAADMLFSYIKNVLNEQVDLAVLNFGGLRAPIPNGPISKGKVYELMPFDNSVTILELNTEQINQLAQHIISKGGEPIGGEGTVALGNFPEGPRFYFSSFDVSTKEVYRVVTSNYLADGGDNYYMFTNAINRTDTNVLLRDVFLERIKNTSSESLPLKGQVEGRIEMNPPMKVK